MLPIFIHRTSAFLSSAINESKLFHYSGVTLFSHCFLSSMLEWKQMLLQYKSVLIIKKGDNEEWQMNSKQNKSIFLEFWHWKNGFYVRDKTNICDTFGQGFCPHSCHGDNFGDKGFHTYVSGHDLSQPPLSCYGGSQSSSLLSLSHFIIIIIFVIWVFVLLKTLQSLQTLYLSLVWENYFKWLL